MDPAGTLLKPWNRVREAEGIFQNQLHWDIHMSCNSWAGRSARRIFGFLPKKSTRNVMSTGFFTWADTQMIQIREWDPSDGCG